MRLHLLAGLALALCLPACASTVDRPAAPASTAAPPTAEAATPTILDTVTVRGTQGLIVAELAYNTAAQAVVTGVKVGLIRPGTPLAAAIRDLNHRASVALEAARATRSAVEQARHVRSALELIAQLSGLTPKAGGK